MDAKTIFKKTLILTCIIYTVFSAVLLCGQLLAEGNADDVIIEPLRFFLLLPYALCTAFGFTFMKCKEIHGLIRGSIHYLCVAVSIFAFLYLPMASSASDGDKLAAFFIISIVYAFAYVLLICIRSVRKKRAIVKKQYKELYK